MTQYQFHEITKWQKEVFGQATSFSKLAHLIKEIIELKDALNGGDDEKIKMEYADCFFLLFGSAAAYGMNFNDICVAIERKFEINKARKWGKPDESGVVEHLKPQS